MENLNLATCGVEEMNEKQMNDVNGGLSNFIWFLIGLGASEILDRNAGRDRQDGYNYFMECVN